MIDTLGLIADEFSMLKYDAGAIVKALRAFQALEVFIKAKGDEDLNNKSATEKDMNTIGSLLDKLGEATKGLPVRITEIAISELRDSKHDSLKYERLARIMTEIGETLRRELSTTHTFCVERKSEDYIDFDMSQIGATFAVQFPSCVFEIDEAGKCYGLSRPTACVFHLMRAMEIGIRATGKCLGIPDPVKGSDKNWGAMLDKIKKESDKRTNSNSWKNKDKDMFSSLYVSLDAVRVAWRNTTMHIENKYTDDEAEHIFIAVRGFLKVLSSRLDETGQPLA